MQIFIKLETSYWHYQRNDVHKMCMDRSSYYSQCRFLLNLKQVIGIIRGTMYTKCVSTVPLTTVNAEFKLNLKKLLVL